MSKPKSAKEGDFRVWWIPQVPGTAFRVNVGSEIQGRFLLNVLANYDLFQLEQHIKPDYTNVGGLERFEDGDWCDFETDEYEEEGIRDE